MNSNHSHSDQSEGQRLLWIALDCSEWSLIEKWMDEGHLPHIQSLYERGGFCRLQSTSDVLVASPSATTMTSQYPVETGFVCWMQWRADLMAEQRCEETWLPITPFYRRLGPLGKRVIAMDIPMAYTPEPFNGMEVVSWGSYDKLGDIASYPADFLPRLQRKYHKLPIGPELGELRDIRTQLKLRDSLIQGTEAVGDACRDLIRDEAWDLFLVGFGATHRAGHNFWDRSSFKETDPPADLLAAYDNALRDVYIATDKQVGKMLEFKPDDAAVMCLATHGFGPTNSRFDYFDQLVNPIIYGYKAEPVDHSKKKAGLVKRLRQAVPVEWRSGVKRRLPKNLQDALTKFWAGKKKKDWSNIRAFTTAGDLEGYVYVNLKGREAKGIVEPADYEPLLREITEGLLTWKDEDTGKRIIEKVVRGNELWPEVPAERRKQMPDLIIQWSDLPLAGTQRMVSEKFGVVVREAKDKVSDGRSGHHLPVGWLVCVAEGIEPGSKLKHSHIVDLAPTAMHLMGLEPFEDFRGNMIEHVARRVHASAVA